MINNIKEKISARIGLIDEYLTSDTLKFGDILKIFLPIFWEQSFLAAMSLINIWLLSLDGENSVAVVNMMVVIHQVFMSVCLGLVTGGTVLVAQNTGAKRTDAACRTMIQSLGFAFSFAVVLGASMLICRRPLVGYLLDGASADIISQAIIYFTGFCLSYPLYAFYQSYAGSMRGWGRTKNSLYLTLSVNCMELLLTAVFLIGFKMGIMGITLATVLSRACGALVAAVLLVRERRVLGIRFLRYLKPDVKILRGILIIAAPLALEQFFFNSGKAVSQRFIAGFGVAHMTANGVTNAVFNLFNIPQIAMREALVTVVGMCIGSGNPALATKYIYKFLRMIRVALLRLMPVTLPVSALLVYSYNLSREPFLLTAACLLLIFAFGPIFLGGGLSAPAGLRGGGDAFFVSATALASMWLVRVTLSYLFAKVMGLGVIGINLAMVIEWAVRSAIYRLRLKGTQWYRHKLIADH